jgi:hypothetical protein
LIVDALLLQGPRVAERILSSPSSDERTVIQQAGPERASVLLHHLSGESVRSLLNNWEPTQLVVALLIVILLLFTDSRKPIALAMCAVMAVLTIIQRSFVTPEWNSLGRQLDFIPEATSFNLRTQIWSLTRVYTGIEILKLLVGGALASYFFAMESVVKRGRSRRSADRSASEATGLTRS